MLTNYNGQTITYDEIGNPLTYRDGMAMEWQNGRELLMCEYPSGYSTYKYGYNGLRTSKTILGPNNIITNVKYIYEGDKLIQMTYDNYVLTFSYDANGIPVSFHVTNGYDIDTDYYYGVNSRGDVIALYNANGSLYTTYQYDAYGKPVSGAPSSAYDIANLNPLRYRSYVYDNETGLYYLQSRYYDPVTCRFINADAYMSTGQGITGNNMFAYCNNNPVMFSDPTGHCAIHTYYYMPSCPECNPELAALHAERGADWATYRNVTQEINNALLSEVITAKIVVKLTEQFGDFGESMMQLGVLNSFKSMVDHGAPWDIKLEEPWEQTIGTPYPGSETIVRYKNLKMTPQQLGNYTYGYLGAAYEIPLVLLYGGSYYAAGFPTGSNLVHEITEDWTYVTLGYSEYG